MTVSSAATRRAGSGFAAVVAATLALTTAPAPAAAASSAAAVPPVQWSACTETALVGFECGAVQVPLDYNRPRGAQIPIALARRPATDPTQKIGTIFLNPGGPGGAGRGTVVSAPTRLSPEVLARFDVVGFDPRGIGASSPIQCFATDAEAQALLDRMAAVPITREQISETLAANFEYTEACKRNVGPLLTHMSTLNVVKDLDRLRQAVGDRLLTYAGFSYGTLIGATYANVFPNRVGRLILDGNVDPDTRTNRRLINKFDRAGGFEITLSGFLAACDASGPNCAFTGNARTKFNALRDRLRQGPVTLPDGTMYTIDDLTNYVGGQLYRVDRYPATAQALQALYLAVFQPGTPAARSAGASALPRTAIKRGGLPDDAYSFNGNDSFFAVNCEDAPLPRNPALYPLFAVGFETAHPTFGRAEAFSEVGCANWPRVDDRYAGPWNRRTRNPILVVNGTFDPATRYLFGQRMARQLGNARLLTLDGYGHVSRFSTCVVGWYTRYLLAGELPPAGTRCAQDRAPFPPPA